MTALWPAFLLLAHALADPSYAAMVLEVKGTVKVQPLQGPARELKGIARLFEGDRLVVGPGSTVLLVFPDKRRERIKASTEATVKKTGCEPAAAVERLGAVPGNAPDYLNELPGFARSGRAAVSVPRDADLPKAPPVVTPMFGTTVLTDRLELTWPAVAGATGYRVELVVAGSNRRLWIVETKEARLPYPEKQKPVERGKKYLWTVMAEMGKKPREVVVQSTFKVSTEGELEELARFKPLAESKEASDLLLLAAAYQAHGAYQEALPVYEKLAKLAPDNPTYQAALADYYERAGHLKKAEAALEQAKKLGFALPKE